ncbi:UNVERIFIED_CONTAM: hypothetical protein Sradi_1762700 [Sesamum radiatum]|uniref:Uncharacterized protein n=1 Tax=Sesamum radiatum TaxID=300843 RepID=A0AAW2TTG0_SESRA
MAAMMPRTALSPSHPIWAMLHRVEQCRSRRQRVDASTEATERRHHPFHWEAPGGDVG